MGIILVGQVQNDIEFRSFYVDGVVVFAKEDVHLTIEYLIALDN